MKKKLALFAAMAIAITGLVTVPGTFAEAGGHKKCSESKKCKISKLKKQAMMLWMHREALGLTEEQLDQLKEIKRSATKDMIRLKADVDITKVDIKSELWESQIDAGKVNRLIDDKYGAKTNIAKTYVKALADMQSVLTEEQRAAWLKMKMDKKMAKYASKCGKSGSCCKSSCNKKGKDGYCPLTGKKLSDHSHKGSMKGSMQ